jgi:hypothetical protein
MLATRFDDVFVLPVVRRSEKHSSGERKYNITHLAVCEEHGNFALAGMGSNYIKTEWETGYMLRDLDGGQVIVA